MYDTIRQQALERGYWKGDKDGGVALQYAEAWRHEGVRLRQHCNKSSF